MIKELANAFGVSGYENKVREIICDNLADLNPKCDKMGNVFIEKIYNPDNPTIILSAHMDEVGFIITNITPEGYLNFDTIGDIKPVNLISRRVLIGGHIGIIALKAIHLTTKEEREKPVKISDLYIDIGASSKNEAEKIIQTGDYCSFFNDYDCFGEHFIKGKALSSRVGCSIIIDILKKYENNNVNILAVFTVQKEVHSRGMSVALNSLPESDYIIVIDAIENDLNEGVILGINKTSSSKAKEFEESIINIAETNQKNISKLVIKDNNDLGVCREKRANTPSVMLAMSCKFKNTATEIISKKDIKMCYDTIIDVLEEVGNGKF